VPKAVEHVQLLYRAAQVGVELLLGRLVHHFIRSGDKHLRGHLDGSGIGHHAGGGRVYIEQDIDRDGARDERVGLVGGDAGGVAGELRGLHVRLHEVVAAHGLPQLKAQ
jgi:hypothetical protein